MSKPEYPSPLEAREMRPVLAPGAPSPMPWGQPELVRLLCEWADRPPSAAAAPAAVERLAQWLHWTDAVAVSAALASGMADAAPPHPSGARAGETAGQVAHWQDVVSRWQATMLASIADESLLPDADTSRPAPSNLSDNDRFSAYRRHCMERQKDMETGIASLRARLRAAWSIRSARGAQGAALDAALEAALGAKERSLLGSLPSGLDRYCRQLAAADSASSDDLRTRRQHALCRQALQRCLRAELEIRMRPLQALLAALAECPEPEAARSGR